MINYNHLFVFYVLSIGIDKTSNSQIQTVIKFYEDFYSVTTHRI